MLFTQMKSERQALRKRCMNTICALVEVVSNEHYEKIVEKILIGCQENRNNIEILNNFVSGATSICRVSAVRFAPFLPKFIPIFLNYCKENEDDELREACIQGFDVFISRCTKDVTPFITPILAITVDLINYDPNYHYGDEDEEAAAAAAAAETNNGMEVDEDADTENGAASEESENDYSDDEDLTWKVRRSSAKCLESLVSV